MLSNSQPSVQEVAGCQGSGRPRFSLTEVSQARPSAPKSRVSCGGRGRFLVFVVFLKAGPRPHALPVQGQEMIAPFTGDFSDARPAATCGSPRSGRVVWLSCLAAVASHCPRRDVVP